MLALQANAKRFQEDASDYVPMCETPKSISPINANIGQVLGSQAKTSTAQLGVSHRNAHQHNTRRRLSKLEGRIHPTHSESMLPTTSFYMTLFIALLGSFQDGWMLSQLNYEPFDSNCSNTLPSSSDCTMFPQHTPNEWTMAVTSWIVGGMIGALVSGFPADKYGRKKTLFGNACIMTIGAIIQSSSSSIYIFSLGRMILGISSGIANNVCNILISEVSPVNMRGLFSTGLQVAVSLGSLAVTTAHYAIQSSETAWRLLVGFPAVLGAFQLILMPFMSSSPVWLISQGRADDARADLKQLYRPCDYEAILQSLQIANEEEQREIAGDSPWRILFSYKFHKQLLIAIVLCSAQQLTGIDAIMYYSSEIFASAGLTDPRVGNTVINVIRTVCIILAAKVMDMFHRKTLLCGGMIIMAIASIGVMLSLVFANSIGCVASLALYMAAFCFSIGPMAWMVSSEIFPDFLHANAGSTGEFFSWLCNFLVGVLYPTLAANDVLGNYAFGIFAGFSIGFVIFVALVVPETAQKTYLEIQQAFGISSNNVNDEPNASMHYTS